jgi:cholesterol oxidase
MPSPAARAEFDVVVIGSGFGGSVCANRLALAGQRVLVLERGPWRDSVPVRSMGIERRAPFPYGSKAVTHLLHSLQIGPLHLRLNSAGLYELFVFRGINAMVASGVGGGSLAYGGLLQPPRNPQFWQGHHPQLDPGSIERHYDKVIADMGGVRLGREHPVPQSVWTQLPDAPARRCQPAETQPHMALLLPPSLAEAGRAITWGSGVERRYCAFDGDSFLGSLGGAKASVDFVYLAPVLGKGATVRDLCQATRIQRARPIDGGGYLVHFIDLATKTGACVRAGRVVLAAGTLNTVRLLFASVTQPDGLAPMPALGRGFSANGDTMGVWRRESAQVSSFRSIPSQGEFLVAGHESAAYGVGGFPGFQTLPIPSAVKRRLEKLFFIYGLGADSGDATVTCNGGRLHIAYDQRTEPVYDEVRAAFRELAAETGDRTWAIGKPFTVHPAGGARLGPDAMTGVVDHGGEVHGNPGLFVADGAALPAALAAPPSVTIGAWAHYVADGIAERAPIN